MVQAKLARQQAQCSLDDARARHATLVAEREQVGTIETRRGQLLTERRALLDNGNAPLELEVDTNFITVVMRQTP